MVLNWRQRKVNPSLYLSIVFVCYTIGLITLAIGLGEAAYTGLYSEIYRFSLPFSCVMVICADIFLFLFTIEITVKYKRLFYPIILTGIVIFVTLFLPWNWWGASYGDYEGQLNIQFFSKLSLVIYSFAICSLIDSILYKARKAAMDKIVLFGLRLLFYSVIFMIPLF